MSQLYAPFNPARRFKCLGEISLFLKSLNLQSCQVVNFLKCRRCLLFVPYNEGLTLAIETAEKAIAFHLNDIENIVFVASGLRWFPSLSPLTKPDQQKPYNKSNFYLITFCLEELYSKFTFLQRRSTNSVL